MLKDMKLAWAMAVLTAVPVALGVAPLAMAQTLTPPTFNWGIQQNQNPAPVSVIGYDSSTNKPCIVGSTITCTLQTTAGSGGGGGGSTPTGTAGTPNANVVTVQGITNGTVLPISGAITQGAGASGNPWYQTIIGPSGNQATVNSTGQLSVSGPVSITGTVPVSGTFWQATQPISASSLPLPTGASAATTVAAAFPASATPVCFKEVSGGTCMAFSGDSSRQAIYVYDADVVGAVNNVKTAITNPESRPATQTITAADAASTSASGYNSVAIITGTPTANSFAGFILTTSSTTRVQLSGTWAGTVQFETAIDNATTGGTTWQTVSCHQQGWAAPTVSATGNGIFECATAGATGFRVRATAWTSGTATVTATFSPQSSPRNPVPIRLTDGAAGTLALTGASAPINIATATTTQLVPLVSGKAIYVTAMDVVAAGTGNITFEYGTGTACGTGTTVLTGAYNLTAQSGLAKGNGAGAFWIVPAGNALCALTSAAVQMSGSVSYAQF